MKSLIRLIILQVAVVLALVLWRPTHRETPEAATSLRAARAAAGHDLPSVSLTALNAQREAGSVSGLVSPNHALRGVESGSSLSVASVLGGNSEKNTDSSFLTASAATTRRPHPAKEDGALVDASVPPVPTAEQMEQALAVPLAFIPLPAEAGLNDAQISGLAEIAKQFNASVAAVGQDSTDPAYANAYHDFRVLADEQVWAVAGQEAYMALIDQRAQAAGNVSPGQGQ